LKHLSTRLVRGWTHLERQRGGIGLRGPGETQLETDRRLIRARIKHITERLTKVHQQRRESRRSRQKNAVPTVALVGYTNAGKSTLFNRLTGSTQYVANRLFATLDPTLRRIDIPGLGPLILADTVGFIRHLPHELISAFHATLEEVSEANLLLHVVDASDPRRRENIDEVNTVLNSIEAGGVPQIRVYNKIDLCPNLNAGIDREQNGKIKCAWISAEQDLGLIALRAALAEIGEQTIIERSIILAPEQAALRAMLYDLGAVLSEKITDTGECQIKVRLSKTQWDKLFGPIF